MTMHGQVSEQNINNATARVASDDLDGFVSGQMQVVFPAMGGWNCFWVPNEGDHVVTSQLDSGEEEGHILGKVYTSRKMPQGVKANVALLVSDNGKNFIRLDAETGTIEMTFDQGATLKFKSLDIEVEEGLKFKSQSLTLEADDVTVDATNATINASASATVDSPSVTITGGTLSVGGAAAPSGQGPFCGLPACLFTGAPHVGDVVAGT